MTMRMVLSASRRRRRARPGDPATQPGAAISMPTGELVGPVLSRVISVFAVRADFSVDRLSDAVLLGDAVSARRRSRFPEGTAHRGRRRAMTAPSSIRVGPLVDGGAEKLLRADALPEIDGSIERARRRGRRRERRRRASTCVIEIGARG